MNNTSNTKEQRSKVKIPESYNVFFKNYIPIAIVAMISAALSAVLAVIGPKVLTKLVEKIQDGITMFGVDIDMKSIGKTALLLVGIYFLSFALGYGQSFLLNNVSCEFGKKVRGDINHKINKLPLKYFDNHSFGETLSYVTNDTSMMSESLMGIGALITSIVTFFGCIIMMFVTEWRLAITVIISSIVGFAGMMMIMGKAQKFFDGKQKSLASFNEHIEEYYTAHNIIRTYNAEKIAYEEFEAKNKELKSYTFKAGFYSGLLMPLMTFSSDLAYVSVSIYGAILAYKGDINVADIIAFMVYAKLFSTPLSEMGQALGEVMGIIASGKRIFGFLAQEEMPDESRKTLSLDNISGNVEFNDVCFGYSTEKMIIHDFSAKIKPGSKVAIVGPTGAGKTTMVNLLMRFYDLISGSITIDGINISDVSRENVHDTFGMVLQDPWLITGTLRENIRYMSNVTDKQIMDICEKCSLSYFVSTLPDGLNTIIDENLLISSGQKQLITIARAMAKNAPMLILDEVTSSVDSRTEIMIQKAMDKLCENRTSFVIAHRLSTIVNADMILYMRDGNIEEIGTHEELLAKNGAYAELYKSQFINVAS